MTGQGSHAEPGDQTPSIVEPINATGGPDSSAKREDGAVPVLFRLPGEVKHDVFDLGVLLEGVGGHVLAETGLLKAAMRHL